MKTYVARRLLQMIPLLFGVSIIVFLIVHAAPGNPFMLFISPRMDPEYRAKMIEYYGFNRPLYQQYIDWLKLTIQGNLGWSIQYQRPVLDMIMERIGPTLLLTLTAEIFALVVAVPIGVISATRQYSKFDYGLTLFAFMGISLPSFFLILVIKYLVGFKLRLLPMAFLTTPGYDPPTFWLMMWDRIKHLIMPAGILAIRGLALYSRFTRSSMLEVVRQDYIRTARAKGLAERLVIYKHALRNSLIPLITLEGLSIGALLSGVIVFEILFTWPGMGQMAFDAVLARDYPVLMTTNLMFALLVMFGNLLADILYAVVDPRIRYS